MNLREKSGGIMDFEGNTNIFYRRPDGPEFDCLGTRGVRKKDISRNKTIEFFSILVIIRFFALELEPIIGRCVFYFHIIIAFSHKIQFYEECV